MFDKYVENRRGLGIKPGLERIKCCLEYLGNPQRKFKSVLITGTNGKGSVTFYLSNLACLFTNYKIGRFTSPHLISWNERYIINEKETESALLDSFSFEILNKIEDFEKKKNYTGKDKLTTFEVFTVIAIELFAREKVDIAFLEAGMGGRLDSTNVVDSNNVLCSIITNVSTDHTKYLGDTIEKIAFEKAGIIKENNFVVTNTKSTALKVIEQKAKELNSKLILVPNTTNDFYPDRNKKTALTAWKVITSQIKTNKKQNERRFLEKLQFPGRFQFIKEHKLLLDGAHNPEAAHQLRKLLDFNFPNKKIIYIIGILDKDHESFIRNLIPENSHVICTEPKSSRATKKETLAECVRKNSSKAYTRINLVNAFQLARETNHNMIVITGSLYLVGEALDLIEKHQIKSLVLK